MPVRYTHTNLVAQDWRRLATFYVKVFGCELLEPTRDLQGPWLDAATGVPGAHVRGGHLRLPGYGPDGPTLEIYQYDPTQRSVHPATDHAGLGHLAFHVDDVDECLRTVVSAGGAPVGDVVTTRVEGVGRLRFVYARDPEGNIIEIQRWG